MPMGNMATARKAVMNMKKTKKVRIDPPKCGGVRLRCNKTHLSSTYSMRLLNSVMYTWEEAGLHRQVTKTMHFTRRVP